MTAAAASIHRSCAIAHDARTSVPAQRHPIVPSVHGPVRTVRSLAVVAGHCRSVAGIGEGRESELVILLTGARYESNAEFDIHVNKARRVGVGWDVIRSIPEGTLLPPLEEEEDNEEEDNDGFSLKRVKERMIPALMREHDGVMLPEIGMTRYEAREREVAIVLFASELLDKNTVCNKMYDATRNRLHGCNLALVKIVVIVGYYAFLSYTLNIFRIQLLVEQSGG
jgi:hypothetical protein